MGIDAPTPAREKGLQPYGALYCFEWRPKVSKGERREAGIQWIQPPKAVSDPEFRQTTSGAHGSANRADCLPRGKPFGAPAGAYPFPRLGPDAPTPARMVGLPPREGQYFLSKRKKVPKKARGTATTEAARPAARRGLRSAGALRAVLDLGSLRSPARKKASTAHFAGGARNVARNGVGQLSHTGGARSCSPFSAVKMGGPFSLRCLSPLCSAAAWVGTKGK